LNLRNEEAQLKDNEGRQEVLSSEVTRQRELLAALTEREVDMNTLARDVDLAQTAYRQFRDNLQRAESSAAMDLDKVSNVSVVQQATLSSDRIRPKRLMNIGFGFAAALAGGLALLLLLEFLDDTVRTREDAERRLDVPVLIEISEREFKAVA
jgi:capsular polysaccharide biosynthesis protein